MMDHTSLTFEKAQELYSSDKEFPVSIHDAAIWVGVRVDSLKRSLQNADGLVVNVDYSGPHFVERDSQGRGGKQDIFLTVDCFKHLSMMSHTERGYEVRSYFLECEEKAKADAKALKEMKEGAYQIQMLVGRQQQTITSLMCSSSAALTAGQLYSTMFPNDPELTIGEKRSLSKFLGYSSIIPANAKHFNVRNVDYSIISEYRSLRMRPVLESADV